VRTIFSNPKSALFAFLLAVISIMMAGCGASGAPTNTTTGGGNTTTTTSGSITLNLVDTTTGAATTSTPATAIATVLDSNGVPISNTVVTFTADNTALVAMSPSSGTALTNAAGVASITVTAAGTAGGATTLTATTQIGTAAVSASRGFALNAQTVTISTPTFGANPLSAYGTTSVSVNVTPATSPLTVSFSSPCASSGKATLSTNIATVAGVATASYLDNGCAGTDTITASVSGMASSNANLVVTAPVVGSLQFVSATPSIISLKGTGGSETSQVIFKVMDAGGNGISGKTVTFDLSTTTGGIALTPAPTPPATLPTAVSDANGLVTITVNAGTVSTAVRVTAATTEATTGAVLQTQSSGLTITTGVPDQDSFSLAATKLQIEGWDLDGETTVLTARLSDHFNNPAPDGSAVNFTTEGGQVVGSCFTANGACSATLTSSQPRPSNGRVTVLAYAVGEESFVDLNANGVADMVPGAAFGPTELIDTNGSSSDMPEAWLDADENGIYDSATEPYVDFNNNGAYGAADGLFNGVLCSALSSTGTCSTTKTINVRRSIVIAFSSSAPAALQLYQWNGAAYIPVTSITLPACDTMPADNTMPLQYYAIRVVDQNGNAMPVGTTISLTTDNGTLSTASWTVPNIEGCNSAFSGCPASVGSADFQFYDFRMKSDATYAAATTTCTNSKTSGTLSVRVTSPNGLITPDGFSVFD